MKTLRKLTVLAFAAASFTTAVNARPAEYPVNMQDDVLRAYQTPNWVPTGCDVGSSVILQNGSLTGPMVSMSDFVSGQCALYVEPNPRTYTLEAQGIGCGSIRWEGSLRTNEGVSEIEITDHRGRLCMDLVPNVIVIKETSRGGEKTLYGHFEIPSPM